MALTPRAPSIDGDIIQAYLPATLIRHWSDAPESGVVWHETLYGALMLCDMSGFTAMSERLAARGKEGAEIMAGVLNAFFERMLGVARRWGGVQMKFGGDAMLLFFEGRDRSRTRRPAHSKCNVPCMSSGMSRRAENATDSDADRHSCGRVLHRVRGPGTGHSALSADGTFR